MHMVELRSLNSQENFEEQGQYQVSTHKIIYTISWNTRHIILFANWTIYLSIFQSLTCTRTLRLFNNYAYMYVCIYVCMYTHILCIHIKKNMWNKLAKVFLKCFPIRAGFSELLLHLESSLSMFFFHCLSHQACWSFSFL